MMLKYGFEYCGRPLRLTASAAATHPFTTSLV